MLVVLFGAVLHASWNALVRFGSDKLVDTALITTSAAVRADTAPTQARQLFVNAVRRRVGS